MTRATARAASPDDGPHDDARTRRPHDDGADHDGDPAQHAPAHRPGVPARPELRLVPSVPARTRRRVAPRFGSGRAPFVLLVVALLVGTTLGLLILNTAIAVDSLKATQLRAANAERAQKVQSLQQQVVAGGTPERIAAAAAAAGLVPAGPAAFLVIAPDGSSTLRGTPEPAAAPPAPATPSPARVAGEVAGRAVAGRVAAQSPAAQSPAAQSPPPSRPRLRRLPPPRRRAQRVQHLPRPEPAPAPAAARPPSAPLRSGVARVPSFPAARRAPGAAARACRWTSADCATAGA